MSPNNHARQEVGVREAEDSDLDSLTTILARSFFPVNAYVKAALPDTSLMREWWREVYREEISSSACHPLIACDPSNDEDSVVGVVCLRLINPGEDAVGGFWARHPWTPDHNQAKWGPPVACMMHYEQKLMHDGGLPYYLLELLAVDHDYKGQGIGMRLVLSACDIADHGGRPVFLQSGSARDFYLRLNRGFRVEAEPDWNGYRACLLVRPRKGA
jgi:GNAT superfamily N-acetyltransferase